MIFEITQGDKQIQAKVSGRLDTPAAVEAQKEMTPLFDNAEQEIILDCADLQYIASSGLRLFLMLRKASAAKGGNVIIENVNEEIRKVFEVTGFLSLFEIR